MLFVVWILQDIKSEDLKPNLQNFVRWTYKNVTKKSNRRKVYDKTQDSVLADIGKRQTRMQ